MANRVFDLPECKGSFQVKGIVSGVEKDRFYTDKKTATGKDFRMVNFGCEYNKTQTVFMNLNGMPQQEVYFSKRNQDTGKTDTKKVAWANRNKFNEEGWRMIGVNLGLVKTTDKDGKTVNDRKTMHSFDACEYIKKNLKDDASVFIKGAIDFSSYTDKEGNVRRSVKYVPNQISLCQDVIFGDYNEENKPVHDFTQTIVYTGIEKEKENEKDTGRFVLTAKIVTWSDIVDTQFIVTDAKLAGLFKKKLNPYTAISVHGRIEVTHSVQEEEDDDCWGESNSMNAVTAPTKTEMIITGASPSTIDKETYTEKNVAEAIKNIKASKAAEQNFSGKANSDDEDASGWGEVDEDDGDEPW